MSENLPKRQRYTPRGQLSKLQHSRVSLEYSLSETDILKDKDSGGDRRTTLPVANLQVSESNMSHQLYSTHP